MTSVALFYAVLALMAVAVVLVLLARRLHVPPAVAFVAGGMVLAVTPGAPMLELDPALILGLFLPPLLQSSAFFTVWRDFRANLRPILLLAIGCVAFTTFAVGWILKQIEPSLPWAACLALGAIVSPPDAVAASAVLERLPLPRRLVTVLEGESLVNDASGLVLYRFAVAVAMGGMFDAPLALASFVAIALGGVATGYTSGRVLVWMTRRLRDTRLEITVSFLAAWASYAVADAAGASGVLSTVACGLVLGQHQHRVYTPHTRLEARAAWDFVVFVLEAFVFILIGLSLRGVLARLGLAGSLALLPLAALVSLAVILARIVWVFPATYLPRLLLPGLRARDPYPRVGYPLVISWSGMRGVVSLAAALALPGGFPGRDAILFVTFGVIVVTVLAQGTTLGTIIRLTGVVHGVDDNAPPEEAPARAAMAARELAVIESHLDDPLLGGIARDLLPEYRVRATWTASTPLGGAALAEQQGRLALRLAAIAAAREELMRLHRAGDIHDSVLRRLEREIDLEEIRIRGQVGH